MPTLVEPGLAIPLLDLREADVFYGAAQALHGVSLNIRAGEVLGLVGRNGAGKSTLLKTLIGLLPLTKGTLSMDGEPIRALSPQERNRRGIAYVPEDRQVFPNLTTHENLLISTVVPRQVNTSVERVYALFPRLKARCGAAAQSLSGGEQQMLAIGRAILTGPRVLLLDEPTEGLAPQLVQEVVRTIAEVAAAGVAIVLVEQNFRIPLELAHRFCVVENGAIAWSGDRTAFDLQRSIVEQLISV